MPLYVKSELFHRTRLARGHTSPLTDAPSALRDATRTSTTNTMADDPQASAIAGDGRKQPAAAAPTQTPAAPPPPAAAAPKQTTKPEPPADQPMRRGKWTAEEQTYADCLISLFTAGTVPSCEDGVTLRAFLAKELRCERMRISKKFAGASIGKLIFRRRGECAAAAEAKLGELREAFRRSAMVFPGEAFLSARFLGGGPGGSAPPSAAASPREAKAEPAAAAAEAAGGAAVKAEPAPRPPAASPRAADGGDAQFYEHRQRQRLLQAEAAPGAWRAYDYDGARAAGDGAFRPAVPGAPGKPPPCGSPRGGGAPPPLLYVPGGPRDPRAPLPRQATPARERLEGSLVAQFEASEVYGGLPDVYGDGASTSSAQRAAAAPPPRAVDDARAAAAPARPAAPAARPRAAAAAAAPPPHAARDDGRPRLPSHESQELLRQLSANTRPPPPGAAAPAEPRPEPRRDAAPAYDADAGAARTVNHGLASLKRHWTGGPADAYGAPPAKASRPEPPPRPLSVGGFFDGHDALLPAAGGAFDDDDAILNDSLQFLFDQS